jgi:hypothetical protein
MLTHPGSTAGAVQGRVISLYVKAALYERKSICRRPRRCLVIRIMEMFAPLYYLVIS